VQAAIAFIASDRGDALYDLIDEESLQQWRAWHLAVARNSGGTVAQTAVEDSLRRFGTTTPSALEKLNDRELVRRSIASLPRLKATLRIEIVATVPITPSTVAVEFIPFWTGAKQGLNRRTMVLRQRGLRWRILASPTSPWVVTGFENILMTDATDSGA